MCLCSRESFVIQLYLQKKWVVGFYESLQIFFPNKVLVSQFRGWSLVYSIDIYILRCLIMNCFYGLWNVSHPQFLERSANRWAHWLCASTTASYTLVYLWIFIDYYGECEMADATTYLEQLNRESTHIYGLHVTQRKKGVESAELTWI